MLNAGATEFKPTFTKPTQIDTLSNSTNKKEPSTNTNETQQQRNKTNARTNKPRKKSASTANGTSNERSNGHDKNNNTTMNTNTASQQQDDHSKNPRRKQSSKQKSNNTLSSSQPQQKKSVRQTQPQQQQQQQQRRSILNTATTTSGTPDPYEHEPATSFITIDQTIDPVQIIPGTLSPKNTVIHGYDRYIAWIERCLEAYTIVTIVGMDPAISDVLSLVTIIQAKGIGSYHELATFSMDQPGGGRQQQHPISGIQFKLHRM